MIRLVRSIWNAPAATPAPPRRVWRDWVLVGTFLAASIVEGFFRPEIAGQWFSIALSTAPTFTLLWRRTRPLLMLTIGYGGVAAGFLLSGFDLQLYSSAYLVVLPYALFRWASGRSIAIGLIVMTGSVALQTLAPSSEPADPIGAAIFVLLTFSLGLLFRFRASGRMRELERAKSFEREQLARDLHDTVAHHVSAIAIQAQAGLAVAASNPEAAKRALTVIEAEASRTLAEMRSMVRVLRRDATAELAPSKTIADVAEFAGLDHGGPRVEVALTGEIETVPPAVAAAVYRLAQESVTNARRHAKHATLVRVSIDVNAERVKLEVTDDGDTVGSTPAGYGIAGMTERAALLGGTLEAGRVPGGGWSVVSELPRVGWSL